MPPYRDRNLIAPSSGSTTLSTQACRPHDTPKRAAALAKRANRITRDGMNGRQVEIEWAVYFVGGIGALQDNRRIAGRAF